MDAPSSNMLMLESPTSQPVTSPLPVPPYRLLSADSPVGLEVLVAEFLKMGYVPHGSPFVHTMTSAIISTTWFVQAVKLP